MHQDLRHQLLGRWAKIVCRHAKVFLIGGLLASAAAVGLTVTHLGFQADRNALVSKKLDWHARYIKYLEDFEGYDRMTAVVEVPVTDAPERGRRLARQFVDELAAQLSAETEHFSHVAWGLDPTKQPPILLRLENREKFNAYLEQMRDFKQLNQAAALTKLLPKEQAARVIDQLIKQFSSELPEDWEYLESEDGRLLFLEIDAVQVTEGLDPYAPAVKTAQAILAKVKTQFQNEVDAGLTGIPVLDVTESETAAADALSCSLVAVALIAGVMLLAFWGVRFPLLLVVALSMGIAWSFGFLTLGIGHLQMLSLFFTAMLLGLGVDFGIHLVSRYELVRHRYPEGRDGCCEALVESLQTAGPGILTGAITTSIAFGTTLLTDFQGMAEMGLIAGVGILLCLFGMLTMLPALIYLLQPDKSYVREDRSVDLHQQHWLVPTAKNPIATLSVTGAVFFLTALPIPLTQFDNNLMALYPQGLEAIRWQKIIQEHSSRDIWYGVSITDDLDEARERVEKFRRLTRTVAHVGGIGEMHPPDEAEKLEAIARVRTEMLPELDKAPDTEEVKKLTAMIREALDPRPLAIQDLPPPLKRESVNPAGKLYQIKIYPLEDVWNPEKMAPFIADLRSVDPNVTGSPVQIYESGRLMKRSYLQAGGLALLACLILILLDFRRLGDALLAMMPVTIGFVVTFGLMWALSIKVNPANIIVLPLLFGIGVDAGVHIVHRYRSDAHKRPLGLTAGTGKGILLTSLSTMIGFGSLGMASHRGIQSLGLVMALGVAFTLAACLFVMPAALELINRQRSYQRYKKQQRDEPPAA